MIEEGTTPAAKDRDIIPATSHGLPFPTALILTILCAVVVIGGSYGILKSNISTTVKASLSIVTLLAVIGLAFAGIQLILALIATTGERRWFDREVGERRTGDRARKPRK